MRRRAIGPVAVAASVIVLLAGCGGHSSGGAAPTAASGSAAAELRQAAATLGDAPRLTMALTVSATPSAVAEFAKRYGDTVSQQQATALAHARLVLTRAAGTVGLTLASGSSTYLSLRSMNHTIYLQADLQDALALANMSATYNSLRTAAAHTADFFQRFIVGGWVSLPTDVIQRLLGNAAGQSSTESSGDLTTKLVQGLATLLTDDTTVSRTENGRTDHIRVVADTHRLAQEGIDLVTSLLPPLGLLINSQADHVASRPVTVDAAVTDGVLSRLSVDLAHSVSRPGPVRPVVVTAAFTRHAPTVAAPAGATPVDISKLADLVDALGGGL